MKKITLVLTVLLTPVVSKNFAMIRDVAQDKKFQQMFFYNIESQLKDNNFAMFLDLEKFVKAKQALCLFDKDKKNRLCLKDAISAILAAQLFMARKILDLRSSSQSSDANRYLFQKIYSNLDWIAEKLVKRLSKFAPQQECDSPTTDASARAIVPWEEINEGIFGENFAGRIKMINGCMQEYLKNPSRCDLLNEVFTVLGVMESEIKVVTDTQLQHDYFQTLRVIRNKVTNSIIT